MQNAQAAQTLASHLRAHGHTVEVQGDQVTLSNATRQVDVTPSRRDCEALRSADADAAQRAINTALRKAGLQPQAMATYRKTLDHRARLDDNFEDIVLRTRTLARCPNPAPEVLRRFEPLARRTANRVFLRFRLPLKAFGYEREDLESVAMVHLVTAIHRYRCGDDERDTMILGRYIRQRLTEVVRKVQRKAKQCSSDTRQRSFADVQYFLDIGQ